jgi:hypothetical protein
MEGVVNSMWALPFLHLLLQMDSIDLQKRGGKKKKKKMILVTGIRVWKLLFLRGAEEVVE